jgi:hypothetical protein
MKKTLTGWVLNKNEIRKYRYGRTFWDGLLVIRKTKPKHLSGTVKVEIHISDKAADGGEGEG